MLTHWDDVEPFIIDRGELRGVNRRLGAAAGAPRLGLSRYEIAAGERAMPLHKHATEEEIFVVLNGGGFSVEDDQAFAIGAGDVILYPAGGRAHTIVAGPGGIDVLAFGSGEEGDITWLPRPNVMWAGPRWLPLDGPNPFRAESEAGPLELPAPSAERPATITAIDSVEVIERSRGDVHQRWRGLGGAIGASRSGMRQIMVEPGGISYPPHCHSAEDELFVVTAGDGLLELTDTDVSDAGRHPVRTGSVVSRPAGTGISHSFRGGAEGMTLLAYSNLDSRDVGFYPRSQKISLRGIGVMLRVERVDYWDGEE